MWDEPSPLVIRSTLRRLQGVLAMTVCECEAGMGPNTSQTPALDT